MAKTENNDDKLFALGKENLKLLGIGCLIIVFGFILMTGGKSPDPNIFNEAVFSFRRTTLATIIVMIGFIFEIYAIMKIPKSGK